MGVMNKNINKSAHPIDGNNHRDGDIYQCPRASLPSPGKQNIRLIVFTKRIVHHLETCFKASGQDTAVQHLESLQ
jgi:hypothetical protein